MFRSLEGLRSAGFTGFVSIRELRECKLQCVPGEPGDIGVYAVLRVQKGVPVFLKKSTGGYFKGRNPNVDAAVLAANWRKRTVVVYLGKAGSPRKLGRVNTMSI